MHGAIPLCERGKLHMRREKGELSVIRQVDFQLILTGLCFAVSGAAGMGGTLPGVIVNAIAAVCTVICMIRVVFSEKQADDEMSLEHLRRAWATTLLWSQVLLTIAFAVLLLLRIVNVQVKIEETVILCDIFLLILGSQHLATGVLFHKYEKEGD